MWQWYKNRLVKHNMQSEGSGEGGGKKSSCVLILLCVTCLFNMLLTYLLIPVMLEILKNLTFFYIVSAIHTKKS